MSCGTFLGFSQPKWVLCSDPAEATSSGMQALPESLVPLHATALWEELVWTPPSTALWHKSHHLREAVSSVATSFAKLALRTPLHPEHAPLPNAVRILSLSKCALGECSVCCWCHPRQTMTVTVACSPGFDFQFLWFSDFWIKYVQMLFHLLCSHVYTNKRLCYWPLCTVEAKETFQCSKNKTKTSK